MMIAYREAQAAAPVPGLGVAPLVVVGAGAVAGGSAVAGADWWANHCREWFCWDTIAQSLGLRDSPQITPPPYTAPAAPQTAGQMTIPGAWTPEAMYETTWDTQQAQRDAYEAGMSSGVSAGNAGAASGSSMPVWILVALAGGVLLLFSRRR